ncbi:hypothetical protein BJ742DRAFT_738336 [Cladochytrium replicatum]|nr:hypothetical protein BJ742DRAFT_738336 [Cladochytrium replicatum]
MLQCLVAGGSEIHVRDRICGQAVVRYFREAGWYWPKRESICLIGLTTLAIARDATLDTAIVARTSVYSVVFHLRWSERDHSGERSCRRRWRWGDLSGIHVKSAKLLKQVVGTFRGGEFFLTKGDQRLEFEAAAQALLRLSSKLSTVDFLDVVERNVFAVKLGSFRAVWSPLDPNVDLELDAEPNELFAFEVLNNADAVGVGCRGS